MQQVLHVSSICVALHQFSAGMMFYRLTPMTKRVFADCQRKAPTLVSLFGDIVNEAYVAPADDNWVNNVPVAPQLLIIQESVADIPQELLQEVPVVQEPVVNVQAEIAQEIEPPQVGVHDEAADAQAPCWDRLQEI